MQEVDPRFMSDDGSLREDSSLSYWSRIICQASAKYNRPILHYDEYVRLFEKAGFVDVRKVYLKSPSNPWPKDSVLKEVGKFQLVALLEGLEGLSVGLLTRALGWKEEEVKVLIAKIRPELKDRAIHSYQTQQVLHSILRFWPLKLHSAVIVGRKPEMPRTPDSFRQSTEYGVAPLTPSSFPTGPAESPQALVEEQSTRQACSIMPQSNTGGTSMNDTTAFTPVIDIPQAPVNKNLKDPVFRSS